MGLYSQNFLIRNLAHLAKYSAIENGQMVATLNLAQTSEAEILVFSTHFIKSVRINFYTPLLAQYYQQEMARS